MARSLTALQRATESYISRAEANGARVLWYSPPCGCAQLPTTAPLDEGDPWDSMTQCYHCGGLHFKIVYHDRVETQGAE